MPTNTDIPTHLNMRIDPKLRYLTELAARARNVTVTEYIEQALWQSFEKVSLEQFPEFVEEPNCAELSPAELQERFRNRATVTVNPLSGLGERLWAEHPFTRIQLLVVAGYEHLLSEDQRAIWNHVFASLATNGRVSTKNVIANWEQIKHHVWLKDQVSGKRKGGEQ